MRKVAILVSVLFLLGCVSSLNAAATVFGISGLVETPDDSIVPAKTLVPVANFISDLKYQGGSGFDVKTFGGAFAILPNLEVSAVALDADLHGFKTQALVNAKYRLLAETVDKPSVTVGVVDIGGKIEYYSEGLMDDVSAFVVVGKNITNIAENVSGDVSKPVHGTIGFGTGLYKGLFAGLDVAVAPKCSLAVEWLGNGLRDESTFSGCLRYQPTEALSIEAGAIGFESFFAGLSFNVSTY